MKLIATLMIAFIVLQVSVVTVPAGPITWICKTACWARYEWCTSGAHSAYRRCQRYGEEAQCQFVLEFQKSICNRQYSSCMNWCR